MCVRVFGGKFSSFLLYAEYSDGHASDDGPGELVTGSIASEVACAHLL